MRGRIGPQFCHATRVVFILEARFRCGSGFWNRSSTAVDEELGWPSPSAATKLPRDAIGAKYNADFPDIEKACLSAYGDSFVWGDEVPLAYGWIEQLSRKLGCRVSNFGVSNYGTDQAYLRFRRMDDRAPVAILGVFPDDMVRNVNQYRGFMGAAPEPFWIKGRYVLNEAGSLEWIARPHLEFEAYIELHKDPARVLPRDYLLPDTTDGPITAGFPYSVVVARLALSSRLWSRLRGLTPWEQFYRADHPSGAIAITAGIATEFVREAERRGKKAFVLMLPSAGSFRVAMQIGKPEYAAFLAAALASGVDVFDPLPALGQKLKDRSFCELYVDPASCQGHFGISGGALVAEVVAKELRRRNLVN